MKTIPKTTKGASILPLFLLCMFLIACGAGEQSWDYGLTGTWSEYTTKSILEVVQDEDWEYSGDRVVIHSGDTLSVFNACSTVYRYDFSLSGADLALDGDSDWLNFKVGTVNADGNEMQGFYAWKSGDRKGSGNWKMIKESSSSDYRTFGSLKIETLYDGDVVIDGENCGNITLDSAYVCVDGLGEENNEAIVITSAHVYPWMVPVEEEVTEEEVVTDEEVITDEEEEIDKEPEFEEVEIEGQLSVIINVPWLLETGEELDIKEIRDEFFVTNPIQLKGDLLEDCTGETHVDAVRGKIWVDWYDYDDKELEGRFDVELKGGGSIRGRFDIYND